MKKILFVCTDHNFPNGAFAFLKIIEQYEPVSVTGLFFSPIEYGPLAEVNQIPLGSPNMQVKVKEKKVVDDNKAFFSLQCSLNHIKFQVHPNDKPWEKDILRRESRFADLLLLSGELFYPDVNNDQPNSFLQEALQVAECPVLVLPENNIPLERLVFAYDGGKESLHAMKQFCYLLPQLTDLPTEIIYVKEDGTDDIPDIEKLKDYCRHHFSSMNFSKLHFKADKYFADWIGEKQKTLMVSGSFGRSSFSYLSRHSFAAKVIHEHKMPVFIAHT
jgi:hypothetical protein